MVVDRFYFLVVYCKFYYIKYTFKNAKTVEIMRENSVRLLLLNGSVCFGNVLYCYS